MVKQVQIKIESHPAVEELYKDEDGYWANLKEGYTWNGCVAIHQYTLSRIWHSLRYELTDEGPKYDSAGFTEEDR